MLEPLKSNNRSELLNEQRKAYWLETVQHFLWLYALIFGFLAVTFRIHFHFSLSGFWAWILSSFAALVIYYRVRRNMPIERLTFCIDADCASRYLLIRARELGYVILPCHNDRMIRLRPKQLATGYQGEEGLKGNDVVIVVESSDITRFVGPACVVSPLIEYLVGIADQSYRDPTGSTGNLVIESEDPQYAPSPVEVLLAQGDSAETEVAAPLAMRSHYHETS